MFTAQPTIRCKTRRERDKLAQEQFGPRHKTWVEATAGTNEIHYCACRCPPLKLDHHWDKQHIKEKRRAVEQQ